MFSTHIKPVERKNLSIDPSIRAEMNLLEKEQVAREMALYQASRVPDFTMPEDLKWEAIYRRPVQIITEKVYQLPQAIFYIQSQKRRFVGRKLVSDLHLKGTLLEHHCSGVTASMLLGESVGEFVNADAVSVFYHPLTPGEKLTLFEEIKEKKHDLELIYPFRYVDKDTHRERSSPENGWKLDKTRAANLGIGEIHLRQYTLKWLSQFELGGKIVYDPACSTGQFLHTIKQAYPDCYTIGQDLSKEMTSYAAAFVDEIYTGDASISFVKDLSIDYAFCRFLNSEVVTTTQAQSLFGRIAGRVKRGGYVIVFGHTPILLTKTFFEACRLKTLQTLAYLEDRDILFQYYVLRKE